MSKLIIIVGLPGSGKSRLGNQIIEKIGGIFIDDVDKAGGLTKIIEASAQAPTNIVLSDPHLCTKENQVNARRFFESELQNYKAQWLFFENNPQKCIINIEHRMKLGDAREVHKVVKLWSPQYYIPPDIPRLIIWQPGGDTSSVFRTAKAILEL